MVGTLTPLMTLLALWPTVLWADCDGQQIRLVANSGHVTLTRTNATVTLKTGPRGGALLVVGDTAAVSVGENASVRLKLLCEEQCVAAEVDRGQLTWDQPQAGCMTVGRFRLALAPQTQLALARRGDTLTATVVQGRATTFDVSAKPGGSLLINGESVAKRTASAVRAAAPAFVLPPLSLTVDLPRAADLKLAGVDRSLGSEAGSSEGVEGTQSTCLESQESGGSAEGGNVETPEAEMERKKGRLRVKVVFPSR